MALHFTCDGLGRRDFLKVGAIGATGLTLASYLQLAAAGEVAGAKAKSAIFVSLQGGPSHMDTFDLKPDAPVEYRGAFKPIKTKAAGVEICEHLPKIAAQADKLTVLRGVSHTLGDHRLGTEYVNTGTRPIASIEYPGYGSVVTKELPGPQELPPFVAIPNTPQRPGFLGVKYAPLNASVPAAGRPSTVRGISLRTGVTITDVEKRHSLLKDLDRTFAGYEQESQLLEGLDRFSEQAHSIITSSKARDAFDISQESPNFTKLYGETNFGRSCLLATRLVEAGVRFVSVGLGGWDTHQDNFTRLKTRLLPEFDDGLSALLAGLAEKGLLDSTVVFVTGEFGRTPKINTRSAEGGRDHYPRCMFMLLAGGGVKGGQVLGESDDKATLPKAKGYSPDDVAATFYRALGIDHTKEYHTNTGRPIMIVRDGHAIPEVFG